MSKLFLSIRVILPVIHAAEITLSGHNITITVIISMMMIIIIIMSNLMVIMVLTRIDHD